MDRERLVEVLRERHPLLSEIDDPRIGILAMTRWQRTSLRGAMEKDTAGRLVGWYSVINYHINVVQLEALHRRGDMLDVQVIESPGPRWVFSEAEIKASLGFYDAIDRAHATLRKGNVSAENLNKLAMDVRVGLWDQHDTSLDEGHRLSIPEFNRLPEPEKRFAQAFAFTFEPIMSALRAPVATLDAIVPEYFPTHILSESDSDAGGSGQRLFQTGLQSLRWIETGAGIRRHPIRNVAKRIGDHAVITEIDERFERMIAILGSGTNAVDMLRELVRR